MDIFSILALIGGMALFLYGMELMGDGLKKLAGGKLESILARLTANRWLGFLLGLVVTAVIQSSSATTVMLVGFVNSGIMKLGQTISIIMGANIGTTVTAWLLSTADIKGTALVLKLLKPDSFTPILAAIGIVMIMMAKTDKKRNTGSILVGFAILMFGMETMSGAVEGLRDNEAFTNILTMFSNNPVMGIIVGTIFTAIIQSSSASVGVLQALAITCVIPYSTAIPVILGQNIGTTITPILSAISGNTESRRVAMSCLYIKMIGVVVVVGIFYLLNQMIGGFAFMTERVSAFDVAVIHTLFNILSTVILMPFCSTIEKLAVKTVKGRKEEETTDAFDTLDDRFLSIPAFAVEKCKELVCDMARLAEDTFQKAVKLLEGYDQAEFEEIRRLETLADKYEDKTSSYLVKIAANQISTQDSKVVTELLHCIGDIERISDHALNIAKAAKEVADKKISFSENARKDLSVIAQAVTEVLALSVQALEQEDLEIARSVEPLEQVIDRLKRKIKNGHISRLRQGDCTMELGFILSDLLTNYERVADHCSNIAACLIEIAHDSFEVHEYLQQVKADGGDGDFRSMYQGYKEKYRLEEEKNLV
ncbi:MAG: Na/Pi cotransporter family protein, partial [Clostridia bacterium]|nr:Na/Pi cotransporter family protein [Clostridia bacterium]